MAAGDEKIAADLQRWFADRFDKLDETMDRRVEKLSDEIVTTRHGLSGTTKQLSEQLVMVTQIMNGHERQLGAIEEWRKEGGPLDNRFRRHDGRITETEKWRNRFGGALLVIGILFPVCMAVLVQQLTKG